MMLGQRDLRAKASMQCLSGLVNEPYFILFSSIGFNFKVLILGAWGLRPTYKYLISSLSPLNFSLVFFPCGR